MAANELKTYYAPAERADPEALARSIEIASNNPVIDGLMNSVSGLLAVLNEQRQIVALNETFIHTLGLAGTGQAFGLRPGEAVGCIYAHEMPGGCGTSSHCSTCGAVVAIVSALAHNAPQERTCAIAAQNNGDQSDLFFKVRACPMKFDGERLILLFLQDITQQQNWALLERVFFHDVLNLVNGLAGLSEMLPDEPDKKSAAEEINGLAMRLAREIDIQKTLIKSNNLIYQPEYEQVWVSQILHDLEKMYANHPAAKNQTLELRRLEADVFFLTDTALVLRILGNMATNAFEAGEDGDVVKVAADVEDKNLQFSVWNSQAISPEVARRVFQRNFSQKNGYGRGLGTYSMKLFGEKILRGSVAFTSNPKTGTTFRLTLPI